MREVGAFELVSDALPFIVERPLDVKVAVLTDVPLEGAAIGALIDVHGVNTTAKKLRWNPMDWKPQVRIEGGRLRKNKTVLPVDHDNPRDLPPGGTSVAFAGWSARHDLVPDADAKVVRVTVTLKHRKPGGGRIRGETVTIRVAR
jgi:hypothetical protein